MAAAIQTCDIALAHHAALIDCGIARINDHHRLDPALPWDGVKLSCIGREFGPQSFDDQVDVNSVMVNTGDSTFGWHQETAGKKRLN